MCQKKEGKEAVGSRLLDFFLKGFTSGIGEHIKI